MKVLVVGATGYIGSNCARHLAAVGHEVTGFARSEAGASRIRAAGHASFVGDIDDSVHLIERCRTADVTVFAPQLPVDQEAAVVSQLLDGLASTGRCFVFTSGTGVVGQRTAGAWSEDTFTEFDPFVPPRSIARRAETEALVLEAKSRGLRSIVVRPPMVWGAGQFAATELIYESVRKTGSACYVGAGLNLYSNVHIKDLIELYRLVIEKGSAGSLYHAVSGELCYRVIAELVARRVRCGTRSVSMNEAIEIWGKFATLIVLGVSSRTRCPRARAELGWLPSHVNLIDSILSGFECGSYSPL
jgi:nucleoside-diphosphate-sugar epimerase